VALAKYRSFGFPIATAGRAERQTQSNGACIPKERDRCNAVAGLSVAPCCHVKAI
jgi:hypothetical protein